MGVVGLESAVRRMLYTALVKAGHPAAGEARAT